ncbi:SulP family inorganic anion transporter [Parahaliea mediterranea]|uniref:Sulfate permease n=1 Tax=Parahaliea mediterranea TaxID=651086 RepID=A0A939DKF6_9GAMM|nr:sulfate permease [Parahaliea mediterranea]MBN7799132.1 sulfate permease [Parahaliea mediterranea]
MTRARSTRPRLARYLPALAWGRDYTRETLVNDAVAALIVTIMLIPQSLAYAMLAGLPPEVGLYASMLPLVAYALFGSSRTLAVGPVAVVSLMTASAIGHLAAPGSLTYLQAAVLLALLSGGILLVMGALRLGFLANFLSHPVISGFITASGIVIALSQLKHVLGVQAAGSTLPELLPGLFAQLAAVNVPTLLVGGGMLAFLFWARAGLPRLLQRLGVPALPAKVLARSGPVFGVLVTSFLAWWLDLGAMGVALVGEVPSGLPGLALPQVAGLPWRELLLSALLISLIGFVESVSVGHTLAARRRQKIDPNQELFGLGAANVASSFSGGYPVTGGFARSVVNFDAGAETPAAGVMTAVGIGLVTLYFTPYLAYLPTATLAATIIVAVLSLVDLSLLGRAWRFGRSDFSAVSITILVTLLLGVEAGVACGIVVSLGLHLYRSSRPHMAIVGEVPGTGHYRNIDRHQVATRGDLLSLRIDESLYFANASFVEDRVMDWVDRRPEVRHVILMCTAVNEIDMSALDVLESINRQLRDRGITLHLSEIKGPVMDSLRTTDFLEQLSGRVFLSHHDAVCRLGRELDEARQAHVLNWEI